MSWLFDFGLAFWDVLRHMAPYLLFGFLMAGLLSTWISPARVERHLGGRGFRASLRASLWGVPLPLCSCGVIPVAAALRRHGAGRGATVSFLTSTPQTGVDSILATYGLLGPVFVLYRVITAFISGVLAGWLTEIVSPPPTEATPADLPTPSHGKWPTRLAESLRYGFVVLPRAIGRSVLLGLLLAGLLGALIPMGALEDKLGAGLGPKLFMMAVGIPLYICSTGSIPMALAFIRLGVSPGAALVFLITGPATNAATFTTMSHLIGRRAVAVYLGVIAVSALAAGTLLDHWTPASLTATAEAGRGMLITWPWFYDGSAVILLLLLLHALWPRRSRGAPAA